MLSPQPRNGRKRQGSRNNERAALHTDGENIRYGQAREPPQVNSSSPTMPRYANALAAAVNNYQQLQQGTNFTGINIRRQNQASSSSLPAAGKNGKKLAGEVNVGSVASQGEIVESISYKTRTGFIP